MDTIVVTGGAGFIGANFVRHALSRDRRARGGPRQAHLRGQPREPGRRRVAPALRLRPGRHRRPRGGASGCSASTGPRPSSTSPPRPTSTARSTTRASFVRTNVTGAFELLEAARLHLRRAPRRGRLPLPARLDRRGLRHARRDGAFSEATPYAPNSPYAASKAGADHLVRAYHETYGLPVLLTNCSNNYGPYQFPEKLIPLMILNAVEGKSLPIYGDGGNVRDWLYVEDHCEGILLVLRKGAPGAKYNIGGGNERTNLQVVDALCAALDAELPRRREPRPRRARARVLRRPQDLRPGPSRPRPPLRDRRLEDPRRARLGAAPRLRGRACARRCAGTSRTSPGARPSSRASTAGSGSA